LEKIGKKVTVIGGDSKTPADFIHFPGAVSVVQQNYIDTDLSQFDLFIILDSGSREMISKKGEVVFPPHLKTVVIDHHASNTGYADLNIVATQYPSTTEILFDLIRIWEISLDHDMAVNLYVGLFTDTGGFRYERVTGHSFQMASALFGLAPDMLTTVKIMENRGSEGRVNFLGLALTQKKVYTFTDTKKGSYVLSYISYADIQRLNLTADDWNGNGVSNILKGVIGWNVACVLIEQEPSVVKISFRTRDQKQFDVSLVAGVLGGGGHMAAAILEAVETVARAVEEVLG
jgi:bifunctional oligoribonuclease and PAP phosphatase NrnA